MVSDNLVSPHTFIECVYMDFDLDASCDDSEPEMIETLEIASSEIKGKKLFVSTVCGKNFYFIKSSAVEWNRGRGFLIRDKDYSEEEIPIRVRLLS